VFLDWTMPGRSGVEVCRALRDDPGNDGMRIVMLTARSQPEDRVTAREMGADDYITKPFSPIQLLEKVRDVLGPEALL
jgi:two-component system phosphate regulon response regulator PhoB